MRMFRAVIAAALLLSMNPFSGAAVSGATGNVCVRALDHPRVLRAKAGHLLRENIVARRLGLSSLLDLASVRRFTHSRMLVPVAPETETYYIDGIAAELRVTRPWTKRFIEDVSSAFRSRFGSRLKITSLTRTAATQRALRKVNGNAAPADGRLRSAHITGAAVDISKQPLRDREVRWVRVVLQHLSDRRTLSAIEEFRQPHFHVFVFRTYEREPRNSLVRSLASTCVQP
jgi:hypothetical protein